MENGVSRLRNHLASPTFPEHTFQKLNNVDRYTAERKLCQSTADCRYRCPAGGRIHGRIDRARKLLAFEFRIVLRLPCFEIRERAVVVEIRPGESTTVE
jgi:hypothetical protein